MRALHFDGTRASVVLWPVPTGALKVRIDCA
jgi:hypothetical protein